MVDVVLYAFSKRRNSTKQPTQETAEAVNTYQVLFKEPFSVTSPVIIIRDTDHGNMSIYNYAYIATFSRYYYITDATYDKGRWFLSLEVDALASHKAEIGNINTYILRSASRYDGRVTDTFYPTLADTRVVQYHNTGAQWASNFSSGYYVVGVIGNQSAQIGAVSYYVMSASMFTRLASRLLNSIQWYGVSADEISPELQSMLFDPMTYVVSAMWFPFSVPVGNRVTSIPVGWWVIPMADVGETPTLFKLSDTPLSVQSFTLTLCSNASNVKHPQAATRGVFLNHAPYTRYTAFIPAFGEIALDANLFAEANTTTVYVHTDCVTGEASCYFSVSTSEGTTMTVGKYTSQVGVPIQLAQIRNDRLGAFQNAVQSGIGAIGNAVIGNVTGAISSASSGVVSSLSYAQPQLSTGGTNGSIAQYSYTPYMRIQYFILANEDQTDIGRPLCANATINTLSGYVLCREGEFASDTALTTEVDTINDYLTGGFYYE